MDISRVNDAYNEVMRVRKILKEAELEFEKNHKNYEEKIYALQDKFLEELDCNCYDEFRRKFSQYEDGFHIKSGFVLGVLPSADRYLIKKLSDLDDDCFNIIRMVDLKGDKAW